MPGSPASRAVSLVFQKQDNFCDPPSSHTVRTGVREGSGGGREGIQSQQDTFGRLDFIVSRAGEPGLAES